MLEVSLPVSLALQWLFTVDLLLRLKIYGLLQVPREAKPCSASRRTYTCPQLEGRGPSREEEPSKAKSLRLGPSDRSLGSGGGTRSSLDKCDPPLPHVLV